MRINLLEIVYIATGIVLVIFAMMTLLSQPQSPAATGPARGISATFWLLLGVIFIAGSVMPHWFSGLLVLAMVALDGTGRVGRVTVASASTSEQEAHAGRLGGRVFIPVLVIPLVTIIVAVIYRVRGLDVSRGALVGLGAGGVAAMIAALVLTRASPRAMMHEGRRLNECMGAVVVLPQLLAALGMLFAAANVGGVIAIAIQHLVSRDSVFLLVAANCLGMTLFTMVMGNSFAAFPVIAAGVLVPLIVRPLGVDPALAAIVTLTAGSSGTLITPMAANFNIVPAALLEMRDTWGVIKFQLPFALAIWTIHVLFLWGAIRLMH